MSTRVTQVTRRVMTTPAANLRVTQQTRRVMMAPAANLRVTQVTRRVMVSNVGTPPTFVEQDWSH
jgi:hypothetical protein